MPDADAVVRYLKDSFTHLNITYLRDSAVTLESIIRPFQSLKDNPTIQQDDALFIYYADHGARADKPSSPNRDGWVSFDSKVEMLCPTDICIGHKDPICNIPDRNYICFVE